MQASVRTLTIIQAVRVRRCWSYELVPCLVGFNIENLVFKRLNPSDPSNYDVIPHPRVFESLAQSLTELQLYMSKFASLIHLVELICSLHKLERLSIESVTWFHIDQEFPSSERYKLPPNLQELQICLRRYDGALTKLMEWVAQYRGGALPAIHTLSIRSQFSVNDRYVYTPAATRVLANVGSSLRRLTLANFFEPRGRWEYPELLAANTELHTLCFRDIDLRDRFEANRILVLRVSWIPSFLIQIASTSVEMMSFEILVRDVEHLGILEWQEIGRAFSLPRFAKLKRLEFKVSAPEQEAARWIEARLPLELMQRGVVHVSQLH
ncbi:hypothetical protein LshimejAT787_0904970 [Lyophyllum shimeji]|uniref:Uncharacterized protein n=1 Tax=Lyophyllum shimeji TaxID=47721 RepID=A0A9P3PTY4_LYOSH|nr:hypothetical protein LshimejAT787_0904970 [Lyophyllum shimeji]